MIYEKYLVATKSNISLEFWLKQVQIEIEYLIKLRECQYDSYCEDYHIDLPNGSVYLVTLLETSTLSDYIKELSDNQVKMPLFNLRRIIQGVLGSIKIANSLQIVNISIRPENIIITKEGDFVKGAWAATLIMKNEEIKKSSNMETSIYIAPEDVRVIQNEKNQNNSESYATGILFLVCCGCPEAELRSINKNNLESHKKSMAILFERFVNLGEIPQEIQVLIIQMTKFDRDNRFDIDMALRFCEKTYIFEVF